MSELVEKVARLICETENVEGFKCTCPDPFEPDWCHGSRAKAQARAAIAAVIEFLYLEAGRSVCPGAAHEYLSATFLEKQIEGQG